VPAPIAYALLILFCGLLLALAIDGPRWYRYRFLTRKAERLLAQGDVAGARAVLERVVAAPGNDEQERVPARLALGDLYRREDRPDEAAKQYQRALDSYGRAADARTAADLRRRIAECLDSLGLTGRAEEERAEAERAEAEERRRDVRWHREEAARLSAEGRHSEAFEQHYRTIESVFLSDETPMYRATLLTEAAETLYQAGRYADALSYLDRVIAGESDPRTGVTADYLRGLTLRALGRLDEAQSAFSAALDVARARREEPLAGAALCGLANLAMDRGRLTEARRLLAQADRECPNGTGAQRGAVACALAIHDGRFEDATHAARVAADALSDGAHFAGVQRVRASLMLLKALARCHGGKGGPACITIDTALPHLGDDEKLRLPCLALALWAKALAGESVWDAAKRGVEAPARAALGGAGPGPADAARDALILLGHVYLALGDHHDAEACFQMALSAAPPPPPAVAAQCAYHIASCREAAGDADGAHLAHSRAADVGGETHSARLSREALGEGSDSER